MAPNARMPLAGEAEGIRYWCPTCGVAVDPEKVHHGTQAFVHIVRLRKADGSCQGCPPRSVPHAVVRQVIYGVIVREETR